MQACWRDTPRDLIGTEDGDSPCQARRDLRAVAHVVGTVVTSVAAGSLRCADWARTANADPVGTAGSHLGLLLVEWPLPWPRDVADIAELAPVYTLLKGRGIRLQLVVPTRSDPLRVALYERPEGAFCGFVGRAAEYRLPSALEADRGVGHLDQAAVGTAIGGIAAMLFDGGGERTSQREVLVCTHGRRDRCCGSMGTELFQTHLQSGILAGVRFGRTSHTGGHRFAPTAMVLPEGTLWGYLDPDALRRVAARQGPLADLLPRFRGSSGVGAPQAQALERSVLAEVGWDLFSMTRLAEELGTGRWRLTLSGPSGRSVWEGWVSPGRTLPVPDCGTSLETTGKSQTEQVVSGVCRIC